ncbi:hypothetical protein [Streptomyces sp. NPDC054865]
MQYGDGAEPHMFYVPRADEPVVCRVGVHGFTAGLDPHTLPTSYFLGSYAIAADRALRSEPLPDGTRRRTEAVVRCLLERWRDRDDVAELNRSAAVARADEHARYEDVQAERIETEIRTVMARRAEARRTINQLTGVIRRRQPAVLPADPTPVLVPFFDRAGRQMGTLTVREKTVSMGGPCPGSVVYTVEGSRVKGAFTVERDRSGSTPWPGGIHVTYGIPTSRYGTQADEEPVINTIRLHGGWSHSGDTDRITLTTPERLPARIQLSRTTGCSAPDATQRRASGVLRALALRYLARPDVEALHLAAAKERAPVLLQTAKQKLSELRRQHRDLLRQVRTHRTRAQQYRDLLTPPATIAVLPDVQSDPAGLQGWEAGGGAAYGVGQPIREATEDRQTSPGGTDLEDHGKTRIARLPVEPASAHEGAPQLAEIAERAAALASKAADRAQRAVTGSRARDTTRLDEAMIAAHAEFVRAEQYARWAAQDTGTVSVSTLRNYVTCAIKAAGNAQKAAGMACTAEQLLELIAEPWTEAMEEARVQVEREQRAAAELREAERRAETGMDADNRRKLSMNRHLAHDQVPKLGWSKDMLSVMEQAETGRLYRKDGFAWNGRRRVSRERVLQLGNAGYLSWRHGPDRRIMITPMGEAALYLARLYPDGLHPDDKTAYEARFAVARRLRRNREETKAVARRLPRLDSWTMRRCARPVTLVEQEARAAATAEQVWADDGGSVPGVVVSRAASRVSA